MFFFSEPKPATNLAEETAEEETTETVEASTAPKGRGGKKAAPSKYNKKRIFSVHPNKSLGRMRFKFYFWIQFVFFVHFEALIC